MSSIMTNASAMTALQTLKQTNKQMEVTQNRISTGYRVAQASDNAAYWSIATTMRSDHSSMSTVQDSLGLGAATVDVAYTAMESAGKYLNEIKSKLVAATATGVDKAKIQGEIKVLQDSLTSLASSASFSGSNWMSVDSSATDYNGTQSIIGSFTREGSGAITLGKIDIDLSEIALFDASATGNGLLQGGTAAKATSADFAWTQGTAADGDTIDLEIAVDGEAAQTVSVTIADAANFSLDDLVAGINASLTGARASAVDGQLVLTSTSTGEDASVELVSVAMDQVDDTTDATIGFTAIAEATGAATGGGVTDINISDASREEIEDYITGVNQMIENVTDAAATLGAVKKRVDMQKDFVSNLMDAIDRGVGQLVDADMEEESTRLQALQVQQQLGIQALSIANSGAQSILSLFR